MKVYAWILCIFSAVSALGCVSNFSDGDEYALGGFVYGVAVAIFTGMFINANKTER